MEKRRASPLARARIRVSPETEKEVDAFIDGILDDLASKHLVRKPTFKVAPFTTFYFPITEHIIFCNLLQVYWEVDREKAKKIIKYLVAHEFCHHLQHVIMYPLRKDLEEEAIAFGETYSKISIDDVVSLEKNLILKAVEMKKLPKIWKLRAKLWRV